MIIEVDWAEKVKNRSFKSFEIMTLIFLSFSFAESTMDFGQFSLLKVVSLILVYDC